MKFDKISLGLKKFSFNQELSRNSPANVKHITKRSTKILDSRRSREISMQLYNASLDLVLTFFGIYS